MTLEEMEAFVARKRAAGERMTEAETEMFTTALADLKDRVAVNRCLAEIVSRRLGRPCEGSERATLEEYREAFGEAVYRRLMQYE